MQPLKMFNEFLFEAQQKLDLHQIYLCVNPDNGQRWWSYKGFAGSKFFTQLTMDNYQDISINPDLPVLNYNSEVCQYLLDQNLIKSKNVYNHPKHIKKSGSKKEFHQLIAGQDNVPQTATTKQGAKKIGLPLIAKPAAGHSGIGIQIFKTQEEWQQADHSKFDIYSEYINKRSEHRIFNFKGQPWFWMERQPLNNKAKTGSGSNKTEMNFKYIKKDVTQLPNKFKQVMYKFANLLADLPFMCFDVMEDQRGKVWIIESNAQPGVPYDSTIIAYQKIFQDFYQRPVNDATQKKLEELATYLNNKTLELDKNRFEIKDK